MTDVTTQENPDVILFGVYICTFVSCLQYSARSSFIFNCSSFQADNDKKNFEKITEAIKESKNGSSLGVITKDLKFKGAFMDAWRSHYAKHASGLKQIDMMTGITYLMAPKEEIEIGYIKKAAGVTSDVFSKYLKEQIMDIIDNDKQVKHSKLAEGVEKAMSDKKYVPNLDTSQLEICYPAIVQSGGSYKLKFSAVSDKEYVHFGAIICSFGARYKSYCSNIVRTMLVNPSDKIQVRIARCQYVQLKEKYYFFLLFLFRKLTISCFHSKSTSSQS